MTVLGQLLIEKGLVSVEQVAEALYRQEQLGGRLGTCLLEIGAINERQLDDALAAQLGMPAARVEDLRSIPEEIHSLLPANLAISCEAVPFRVRNDQVDVAILEIKNRGLHDELAFVIGKWIHVHIANEVRIFEALKSYYGKDLTPRYGTLLERLDVARDEGSDDAPPSSPADLDDLVNMPFPDLAGSSEGARGSLKSPAARRRETDGPKLVYPPSPMRQRSVELSAEERAALGRREAEPEKRAEQPEPAADEMAQQQPPRPETSPAPEASEPPPEGERHPPTQDTIEEQPKATVEPHPSAPWKAESADDIGHNLLRELGRRFRRVALYRVGHDGVKGWMGKGEGFDAERFASYRAALAQNSVFDSLASGGHLYVGRLTSSAAHDALLDAIGAAPDTECMLAAISVGGRVVALAYADRGAEGLGEADLGSVPQLSSKAGEAMRALILRRKRKQA